MGGVGICIHMEEDVMVEKVSSTCKHKEKMEGEIYKHLEVNVKEMEVEETNKY